MFTQTSAHSLVRSQPARLTLGCWAFIAALGLLAGCNEEDLGPGIGDATETSNDATETSGDESMTDTTEGEDDGEISESDADLPGFPGDGIDSPEVCVPVGDPCSAVDTCCDGGICQIDELGGGFCVALVQ
jgi:hypothetical protein